MHISAHIIESYPREYGSWSWAKEKLSIPLEVHDKAQLSEIFQVFFQNLKSCNFFIFGPILLKLHIKASEIESFLTTYGLSNCGEVVVHTFSWLVTGHCLRAGIIEGHNFFVLHLILVKFYI